MREIAVVTVARSDYSILRPVLNGIEADPDLRLRVLVTGMHLSHEFGYTVQEIENDGFGIHERVEMLLSSDTPCGIGLSTGAGISGFSRLFSRYRPDVLVIMGDRFEMLAAAVAATPFGIPIAHIHGGELSEGAFDDAYRHSITKMSHFHFVSTQAYGRRVEQLGEDPARVSVCGAPALDNLSQIDFMSASELEHAFGINLAEPPLLVTFHPTTLDVENTESDTEALLSAIREIGLPVIFTLPNADTAGRRIIELITEYVSADETAFLVPNFGLRGYYSALNFVRAMVGNTSSGIIEAASFTLPVVDIGDRQRGRITGRNVIHAPARRSAVANAIREALSDPFVQSLNDMRNPYGDGNASETIVAKLKSVDLGADLIKKRFYDLPNPGSVERR